jgi:iron complex outermembrane recepter protein
MHAMRRLGMTLGWTLGAWMLGLCPLGWPFPAGADPDPGDLATLKSMSLEDLADMKISIASRTPQSVADSAAAVFVITRDDIRRSGATSIPELLRLVPGLNVARIDANKWAVSARGFNGRFANKLLVLMDGRSIYNTLYSGVYWNVQDTLLEDIERIEVIRGPGASVWGANAVNGVVNIITRSAADTQGGLVGAAAGSRLPGAAELRYGGDLGEDGYYRVFAKYRRQDDSVFPTGEPAHDGWHDLRVGFRVDALLAEDSSLTVQGEAYRNRAGETLGLPSMSSGVGPVTVENTDSGASLLARWQQTHADAAYSALQLYFDSQQRQETGGLTQTADLDYQYRPAPANGHAWSFGAGYRWSRDQTDGAGLIELIPRRRASHLLSAYLQDEIRLGKDWLLTLGSKLEHNDFTGFEIQPSARLLWRLSPHQSVWLAVSRAVRTPSLAELGISADYRIIPARPPLQPYPLVLQIRGNPGIQPERLIAYELGYRFQVGERLSVDLSAYYNDYSRLRTLEPGAPSLDPLTLALVQPLVFDNQAHGETYGLEAAVGWRPAPRWRLQLAYSVEDIHIGLGPGSRDTSARPAEGQSPQQQLSLRTSIDPGSRLELDFWLRYTDGLPAFGQQIPSYWALDARLGWQPTAALQLALVGQNLLDTQHAEFRDEGDASYATQVRRGYYLQGVWRF